MLGIAKIRDLAVDGTGIGVLEDGAVIFVEDALPGETIRLTDKRKQKKIFKGKGEILRPSQDRRAPFCPVFQDCGGCQIQHLDYKAGLEWKKGRIASLFARISKLESIPEIEISGMASPFAYRNTVQVKCQGRQMGFYAKQSHRIVPFEGCKIMPKRCHELLEQIQGAGLLLKETIRMRLSESAGTALVVLDQGEALSNQEAWRAYADGCWGAEVSFWLSAKGRPLHLHGPKHLEEQLLDLSFQISPNSFFQTNLKMTPSLYQAAIDAVKAQVQSNEAILLDLYTGTGTLAMIMAKAFPEATVYGVDIEAAAIEDAKGAALANDIDNCRFVTADCEAWMKDLGPKADLVLVDPPRNGLTRPLTVQLTKEGPPSLVYISCDPASLARDLSILKEAYELLSIKAFDMFPWTTGVETVCLLSRRTPKA